MLPLPFYKGRDKHYYLNNIMEKDKAVIADNKKKKKTYSDLIGTVFQGDLVIDVFWDDHNGHYKINNSSTITPVTVGEMAALVKKLK